MSTCCSTNAIADHFGRKTAAAELRRYQEDGPLPTTRALIDSVRSLGVAGAQLLDVGAGVGAIHHALLDAGASSAVHVDISPAFVDAARTETERRRNDRVRFIIGDFVELASTIDEADVVTLDRVICCYADMPRLVERSAAKARRMYGAVYPRNAWWVRIGIVVNNMVFRVRRSDFRSYLHSPAAIDAVLRRMGLERRSLQRTWVWEVAVYVRQVTKP
jgi:2-polyprenyl-3-methyl-5-hydroxy-6-metoxy-1,4-benzoquinol methylase